MSTHERQLTAEACSHVHTFTRLDDICKFAFSQVDRKVRNEAGVRVESDHLLSFWSLEPHKYVPGLFVPYGRFARCATIALSLVHQSTQVSF